MEYCLPHSFKGAQGGWDKNSSFPKLTYQVLSVGMPLKSNVLLNTVFPFLY